MHVKFTLKYIFHNLFQVGFRKYLKKGKRIKKYDTFRLKIRLESSYNTLKNLSNNWSKCQVQCSRLSGIPTKCVQNQVELQLEVLFWKFANMKV